MAEYDLFPAADASKYDRAVVLLLLIYLYEELLRPLLRPMAAARASHIDAPDPRR